MKTRRIEVDTSQRWYADLTPDARALAEGGTSGLLNVFVPHATAGLAIMELGDGSEPDLAALLERLIPHDSRYVHQHGSPGHGADHLLPVLLPPSVTIPVVDGQLQLGRWQYIVLVDTNRDNPRREVLLSLLEG